MKKLRCRVSVQGSFTIEAVLVMSVVIASLTALLICSFFIHDRAVLRSRVCEIAAAGGIQAYFSDSMPFSASEASKGAQHLMLRADSLQISSDSSENRISVQGTGEFSFPGYTADFLGEGTRKLDESWERNI